jgi:acylaminoacyl-peptidase
MRPITSDDLYAIKWVRDPQISPDGTKVLFELKEVTPEGELKGYNTHIWIFENGKARQFTSGGKNDTSARWSPCGKEISFISDRDDKNQLYVLSLDGGEAQKLTSMKNGVNEYAWSPDGRKIAFCALLDSKAEKETDEGKEKVMPTSDVRVVNNIRYKANGKGFLPEGNSQIFVLDVDSREVKQITQGPYDCKEPAWSPDGSSIVFVSSRFEDNELSSVRDLWTIPSSGGPMQKLTSSDAVLYSPSWSPDGEYIACYGHDNEYNGATVTCVCVIASQGGPLNFITKPAEIGVGDSVSTDMASGSSSRPAWSPDGKKIFFSALDHGRCSLYTVGLETGEIRKLTHGDSSIYGWSKADDCDKFALSVTSPEVVGDIWMLDLGSRAVRHENPVIGSLDGLGLFSRLTDFNKNFLESVCLSCPEEVEILGRDGQKLQAWIMKPIGIQEGNKYPLVLEIHGGPHVSFGFSFFHEFQVLASRGYGVMFGNPRGSTGYGQEFVAATHHDWGGKDFEDIMSFADYAATVPWVDTERMGVTGGSYGGYMTNWVVGHTNRFKAAVSQRSTCNRFSQFGTSDAAYMNSEFEFDGNPWDNPMAYLDRSPIMYVRNVETPLLLVHSEQDLRCPIGQAEEFFVALKKLKKTVVMVRFPGENHELSRSGKPKHRVERLEYILAWFDRYIGPVSGDYTMRLASQADVVVNLPM